MLKIDRHENPDESESSDERASTAQKSDAKLLATIRGTFWSTLI